MNDTLKELQRRRGGAIDAWMRARPGDDAKGIAHLKGKVEAYDEAIALLEQERHAPPVGVVVRHVESGRTHETGAVRLDAGRYKWELPADWPPGPISIEYVVGHDIAESKR